MALKAIHYVIGGGVALAVVAVSMYFTSSSDSSESTDDKKKEAKSDTKKTDTKTDTKTTTQTTDKKVTYTAPSSDYKATAPSSSTSPVYNERPKDSYKGSLPVGDSTDSWYNFGVTSTGRLETIKNNTRLGDWGTRNRVLAHYNEVVVGRKLGIV